LAKAERRFIWLFTAVLFSVLLFFSYRPVFADDFDIQNGVIVKYNGTGGDVVIPDGVTAIGDTAFLGHTELRVLTIPNGVTRIGQSAFEDCSGLTSVTIAGSVDTIGAIAFQNCTSLNSLQITDGVKQIDSNAFQHCNSLTEVTIPASVTNIDYGAFCSCIRMTAIHADAANPAYCDENGILFSKDRSVIVQYPAGINAVSYAVGSQVKTIGRDAFYDNVYLKNITLPEGVTDIQPYAFKGCLSLSELTVPDSVTAIEMNAFQDCAGLTQLIIPESVTTMGENVFQNCTNLTVCGIENSLAQKYAAANNAGFRAMTADEMKTALGKSDSTNEEAADSAAVSAAENSPESSVSGSFPGSGQTVMWILIGIAAAAALGMLLLILYFHRRNERNAHRPSDAGGTVPAGGYAGGVQKPNNVPFGNGIVCPNCGVSCPPDAFFCDACGEALRCPYCGAPYQPQVRFCTQCGQPKVPSKEV